MNHDTSAIERAGSGMPLSVAFVSPGWPPDAFANGIIPYVANHRRRDALGRASGLDRGRASHRVRGSDEVRNADRPSPVREAPQPAVRAVDIPGVSGVERAGRSDGDGPLRALIANCRRLVEERGAPARRDGGVIRPGPVVQRALPIPVVVRLHGPWFLNGPLRVRSTTAEFRRARPARKGGDPAGRMRSRRLARRPGADAGLLRPAARGRAEVIPIPPADDPGRGSLGRRRRPRAGDDRLRRPVRPP